MLSDWPLCCKYMHWRLLRFGHQNEIFVKPAALLSMMTSSNGNVFRVTGPLCGKFTGHRWIPLTVASDSELWCFFDMRLNKRLSKQPRLRWFETPSSSLWRHCNGVQRLFVVWVESQKWNGRHTDCHNVDVCVEYCLDRIYNVNVISIFCC